MWDPAGLSYQVLVLAAAGVAAFAGPGARRLDRVAQRWGLPGSEQSRGLLRAYLRRTRRGRAVGVALAAFTSSVLLYAWSPVVDATGTVSGPFAPFGIVLLLSGYFTGSALSEVTWRMPASGARRAAGLEVRRRTTYLPSWVTAWQRALAVLALVLLGALLLLVRRPAPEPDVLVRSPAWGSVLAALVVACALLAELGQRRIVTRPQSWTDADTVTVDDAVRAHSQRNLAVAVVSLELLLLTQLAIQVLLRLADVVRSPGVGDVLDHLGAVAYLAVPLAVVGVLLHRLRRAPRAATVPARGPANSGTTR